jgi:hypothetical protein
MNGPFWNPKVRWYDWFAAVFAADLLWVNAKIVLFSENFLSTFFATVAVYFIWDIWNWYCGKFRLRQEFERFQQEVNTEVKKAMDKFDD